VKTAPRGDVRREFEELAAGASTAPWPAPCRAPRPPLVLRGYGGRPLYRVRQAHAAQRTFAPTPPPAARPRFHSRLRPVEGMLHSHFVPSWNPTFRTPTPSRAFARRSVISLIPAFLASSRTLRAASGPSASSSRRNVRASSSAALSSPADSAASQVGGRQPTLAGPGEVALVDPVANRRPEDRHVGLDVDLRKPVQDPLDISQVPGPATLPVWPLACESLRPLSHHLVQDRADGVTVRVDRGDLGIGARLVSALPDRSTRAARPGPASSRRFCMRRRTTRASSSATAPMGACPRALDTGTESRDPRAVRCARESRDTDRKQ
jgi:hypothetical protein